MRLIIAGSRGFDDAQLMADRLSHVLHDVMPDMVVCGGAMGADTLGKEWAEENDVPVRMFVPDWDGLGRRAGYVRNAQMARFGTHLIAFYDGESKGTKHMITIARKHGLDVRIVRYTI